MELHQRQARDPRAFRPFFLIAEPAGQCPILWSRSPFRTIFHINFTIFIKITQLSEDRLDNDKDHSEHRPGGTVYDFNKTYWSLATREP